MPITITVSQNGPLRISAEDAPNVVIVDHEGRALPPTAKKGISLCRCGASTKKPFCDGTHSKVGFKGAEEARERFDQARDAPPDKGTVGA